MAAYAENPMAIDTHSRSEPQAEVEADNLVLSASEHLSRQISRGETGVRIAAGTYATAPDDVATFGRLSRQLSHRSLQDRVSGQHREPLDRRSVRPGVTPVW